GTAQYAGPYFKSGGQAMKMILMAVLVFCAVSASAQDIQINKQNKTIAITADESVTLDAEIAILEMGYHNYATTQDGAFEENVRVSNKITKALLDAHIPKENIETEKLQLNRVNPDANWTPEIKRERQFLAQQSWKITVRVAEAQSVVDLAVRDGANEVDDTDWDVADPLALQAKASGAALAKARAIAEQMAKGLGANLGELVYASNRAPVARAFRFQQGVQMDTAAITSLNEKPQLTLFPQKVKQEATVYA